MVQRAFLILMLIGIWACKSDLPLNPPPEKKERIEAIGFDGTNYQAVQDAPVVQSQKDSLLNLAYQSFLKDSTKLDNIIWYGRRLAYLTRYQEAINVFTQGMKHHPESPELYRHRGHRNISVRKPIEAVADLMKAARLVGNRPIQIEADGFFSSV